MSQFHELLIYSVELKECIEYAYVLLPRKQRKKGADLIALVIITQYIGDSCTVPVRYLPIQECRGWER